MKTVSLDIKLNKVDDDEFDVDAMVSTKSANDEVKQTLQLVYGSKFNLFLLYK